MASDPAAPTLATMNTTTPVPRPQRLWPGLALATAGSIAFSGKAIIVKLAYRHGVDAVTLIMYRMLFALPLFLGLAWWAGRGRPRARPRATGASSSASASRATTSRASSTSRAWPTSAPRFERLVLYLNPTLVLLIGRVRVQAPRRAARSWSRWP